MIRRTTASRNKIYMFSAGSRGRSSGGCAFRPTSPPVGAIIILFLLFQMFFFEAAVFGAGLMFGLMFVPGNKMSPHRTRCPDAVLLVATQVVPVVYWHYTAHCITGPQAANISCGIDRRRVRLRALKPSDVSWVPQPPRTNFNHGLDARCNCFYQSVQIIWRYSERANSR